MPPLKKHFSTAARGGASRKSRGAAFVEIAKPIANDNLVDHYLDSIRNERRVGWGVVTIVDGTQHHLKSAIVNGTSFIYCALKQVYETPAGFLSLRYPWIESPDEEPFMLRATIGHILLWDGCMVEAKGFTRFGFLCI